MLFDLRGRRRRAVQATYLTLALLMGGGLVFFGIGGNTSGGLFDAFGGGGGGGNGNSQVEKQIERLEARARRAPRNTAVMAELVRANYNLAASKSGSTQSSFSKDAKPDLRKAGAWWQRYLRAARKPDPSLARIAMQVYSPGALEKPAEAKQAALIVAEATNDANAYLQVVQFAALSRDFRTRDLAAQKAIDLAPKSQRKQVKALIKQAKNPQAAQPQTQPQGGG